MLGSAHDGEVLNAARHIDALVKSAGTSWQAIIPDLPKSRENRHDRDLVLLDQLLDAETVSEILKLRLRDMRDHMRLGRLSDADRRLLRILHRKAVIDGAIVTE
jgi:hypothetical protein